MKITRGVLTFETYCMYSMYILCMYMYVCAFYVCMYVHFMYVCVCILCMYSIYILWHLNAR